METVREHVQQKTLGEDASNLEKLACTVLLNCAGLSRTTPHNGMHREAKDAISTAT